MRIRLKEAVASYNKKVKGSHLKMTNTYLSQVINYDKMSNKALQEYLSHYNKGKYLCPIVILKEISLQLGVSYEELLGVDKINRNPLTKLVDFLVDYLPDTTIKDLYLLRGFIISNKK